MPLGEVALNGASNVAVSVTQNCPYELYMNPASNTGVPTPTTTPVHRQKKISPKSKEPNEQVSLGPRRRELNRLASLLSSKDDYA